MPLETCPTPNLNRFADEMLKKDRFFRPFFRDKVIATSTFKEYLNRKLSQIKKLNMFFRQRDGTELSFFNGLSDFLSLYTSYL